MSTDKLPSEQSTDKLANLSRTEPEVDPGEHAEIISPDKSDSPSTQQVAMRSIERFSAMMMQSGPGRDPFVEKMTPEHVTAVIAGKDKDGERKHTEELAKIGNQKLFICVGVVFVLLLCGLFLHYQQTDHLDAIIGALAGLAGGFGLGRASQGDDHKA